MSYNNARVVVLGAAGFIGRWIARTVPDAASRYLVVRDAESAGKLFSQYNITGTLVTLDLTNFAELEKLIREVHPSIVFNLAGYGVDPKERDAGIAKQLNVDLPDELCRILNAHADPAWTGQTLIHAGTALEYGVSKGILSEDLTPQPTTVYGITKLAGTGVVAKSNLKALVVRLFNIYGPGELEGRLLPSLLETARTGNTLALTPGTQKRDFTYVEDVATGWVQLGLLSGKHSPVVNLATGQLHTVREFAEIAAGVLNIEKNRLQFGAIPFRKEEMDHDGVSNQRLKDLIQWTPVTTIEQGVQKTVQFLSSFE